MEKSLDQKLSNIRLGNYQRSDFIIADAKDGDMGGGIQAFGERADGSGKFKSMATHIEAMKDMTQSGLVDIMLMSASAAQRMAEDKAFDNSAVTPAVRLNDTTDIWGPRHSRYKDSPACDFRSARIDQVKNITDLGLYSITFSNDLDSDLASLESFHAFLDDLSGSGVRYFLEIFNPQIDIGINSKDLPEYVNDCIVRCLAGLTREDRPHFLKMPYNGPKAMEEICDYDPGHLVVGVLGGGKGTTRDTLELIRQSEKFGARVALFGRKILFTEDPKQMVRTMRSVVEGDMSTEEAVKAYHGYLAENNLVAKLSLEEDLKVTDPVLQHDLS